ncbi:MAG: glycosyltransferase family 4 protein [Bryobacteraceae bacterium]
MFDYRVARTNPTGGCHLRLLRGLAHEHQFTVFSVEFENPCPERIEWVRIPVPMRPLALLFVAFHVIAPVVYLLYRLRTGARFDLVQMVESNLSFGDVSYAHFCHTAYLKDHWKEAGMRGLRGVLRRLDHTLHATMERFAFRRAHKILVPSRGLAKELSLAFPFASEKIEVIPNAVDVERLKRPASFDRDSIRVRYGFGTTDVVFLFAALGQFERKGLPLLLEALKELDCERAKLVVVGGERGLVAAYQERGARLGLERAVVFTGMQADLRPYLWAADAFVFPSSYETFSLVAYEAAAAGLPLIVPPLNGIEELIRDGENGFVVSRTRENVKAALRRFMELPETSRGAMGERAARAAAEYNPMQFEQRWRVFYNKWISGLK